MSERLGTERSPDASWREQIYGRGLFRIDEPRPQDLSIFTFSNTPGAVSTTTGFVIGALSTIGTGTVRFEPGLLFAQEGASGPGATVTANYLLIPLAAKYTAVHMTGTDVHLRGGLAPAVLLGASAKNGGDSKDVSSSLESFDLQGLIGLGTTIASMHGIGIALDASYLRGFLNLAKEDKTFHNTGFILSVGENF